MLDDSVVGHKSFLFLADDPRLLSPVAKALAEATGVELVDCSAKCDGSPILDVTLVAFFGNQDCS